MIINKEIYPRGYWQSKDNLLYELNEYINEYGTLVNIRDKTIKSKKLYYAILRQKYNIDILAKELGYDINTLRPIKQTILYETKEQMKLVIENFITEYNRFPTVNDFRYTLGINSHILKKHNGIYNLKKLVNWKEEYNLIDDNGWYNKSSYEYITAQYLIYNNVSYKREQHPFPKDEGDFRSDFMFETKDDFFIHCEVWGMECMKGYEEVKNYKLELYNKYNIPLTSLDYSVFTQSYKKTQEVLHKIFSRYMELEFKTFDNEIIIPYMKMSDEDILNELLKHSKDGETLPTVKYLKKNHIYMLYYEANKRYNGYYNFAAKFGKKTTRVDVKLCGEENAKRLFNLYLQMINEFGYIPNKELIENRKEYKTSLSIEMQQYGGKIGAKLAFYQYCYDNKIKLTDRELLYLSHIFNGKNKRVSNFSTSEHKKLAMNLLDNYNKSIAV